MKFEPTTLHWCLSCQKHMQANAREQEIPFLHQVMHLSIYACLGCGSSLKMAYHWHKKGEK